MKVALIFPNNLYTSPYLTYYTQLLEKEMVPYDIISWNRNDFEEKGTIAFTLQNTEGSKYLKILDYFKFRKFVVDILQKNKYDRLIVFTCQLGIYLRGYLKKNFANKYILDVRDYSPMIPYFQKRLKNLAQYAHSVCISSNGFKTWLPKKGNYVLSHNVNIRLVNDALDRDEPVKSFFPNKTTRVDTIGQIKDFESDSELVSVLGNNPRFHLRFIGFGPTISRLKEFVKEKGIGNVLFTGPYKKEEEYDLLKNTDFINILISNNTFNNQVLSNRIYLSALLNIPCLVNHYTVEQQKIIEKYQFGIVVTEYDQLPDKILAFRNNFNSSNFMEGCRAFLKKVSTDHQIFEKTVTEFIKIPDHVQR